MTTAPSVSDSCRQLWARILTVLQNRSGSNPANNPADADSKRQLMVKVLNALIDGCVNLIPAGAVYDDSNRFYLLGIDLETSQQVSLLVAGQSYILTWGTNEVAFNNDFSNTSLISPNPGAGQTLQFICGDGNNTYLTGSGSGNPVTATICAV